MNILYASNNKFISIMLTSIVSLLENTEQKISLYIIDDDISEKNKNIIKKKVYEYKYVQNLIFIDASNCINRMRGKIRTSNEWPMVAFVRLYLTELLPNDIEKILYMDCDTIICDDICDLWNEDITEYNVAGVLDCMDDNYKEKIGLGIGHLYINSGVLLFNLNKLRDINIEKEFVDLVNKRGSCFKYPDQDVINVVMRDSIKVLPMKYNVVSQCLGFKYEEYVIYRNSSNYYTKKEYDESKSEHTILHMTGGFMYARPWYYNSKYPYKDIFSEYYMLANGNNEFWGEDNRNKKQILVSIMCNINIPWKMKIIAFLRKINNR